MSLANACVEKVMDIGML